jgi:hypothetical protein
MFLLGTASVFAGNKTEKFEVHVLLCLQLYISFTTMEVSSYNTALAIYKIKNNH